MKKLILLMAAGIIGSSVSLAQEDKAKTILDAVSKKTKAYKTMQAEFEQSIENKGNGVPLQKTDGKLHVKGSKYKVDLGDTKIFCDGVNVWTWTKDGNECIKESIETLKEEGDYMDLGKLMTIWEEGYKRKYVKEYESGGKKFHVINLYPNNPKEADFHTMTLTIDDAKKRLEKIVMKGRDGTVLTFKIKSFTSNKELSDSMFKFDKSKFPGCTVTEF